MRSLYIRRDMPLDDVRKEAAHLGRHERIDRIVALDDFDVELAAMLREYLLVPGMGEKPTARAFRDELRRCSGAPQRRNSLPRFRPCTESRRNRRMDAADSAAVGVETAIAGRRARDQEAAIGRRGCSRRSRSLAMDGRFLIEQFVPGDVCLTSIRLFTTEGVRFAVASRCETPPFQVAHEGGSS